MASKFSLETFRGVYEDLCKAEQPTIKELSYVLWSTASDLDHSEKLQKKFQEFFLSYVEEVYNSFDSKKEAEKWLDEEIREALNTGCIPEDALDKWPGREVISEKTWNWFTNNEPSVFKRRK